MEKYNLSQTGPEVQEILNNATPQSELTAETQRAQLAEQTLQGNIDNEALTRENADTLLQTNIGAEETRAKAAEKQNADDIDALEALLPSGVSLSNKLVAQQALGAIIALIPSAASALNQLADKAFVNSSIATNTATFRGTFNLVSDLHLPIDANHETIALNLLTVKPTADNNDFCYVQIPDSAETPTLIASTDRYKFNGTEWAFEYTLNTSGFTAAQWDAINSGITAAILESLTGIPALIPSEATDQNQLADKVYVLTQILLATPAFKGQFTTLTQLQAVTGAKAGDIGIVRTKDTDGHDVFTFYQYKNDQWNEFYTLSYHPQDKPATTGLFGEAPYNGMGRVELPMNLVEGWPDNTWIYIPKNDVVYLLYSWRLQLYAVYNSDTQEGLGLDDNLVIKPANYDIADLEEIVDGHYLPFTEDNGVWTITKPDDSTITSTELNNTNIYNINDPTHHGINVLTQAMLNRPNTIYVIQHDYDLNGETISIPATCVLQFDGGSLRNGSLVLQNTLLDGVVRLGADVEFSGTCANSILTPKLFGAKGDGITDDTQSFKNLANVINNVNSSKTIYVPSGEYIVNELVNILTSCKIYGEGEKSVLKLIGGKGSLYLGWGDDSSYWRSCNLIPNCTITDNALKGSNTISVNSTTGINPGDYIIITDTADGSFSKDRASYRTSELVRVKSIENNVITIYTALYGNYYVNFNDGESTSISDAPNYRTAISKFTPNQYIVSDIKIVSTSGSEDRELFSFGAWGLINSEFRNIIIENYGNKVAASIGVGEYFTIDNCSIKSYVTEGSDLYGLSIIHSQNFKVSNSVFKAKNHALATGGASSLFAIINRNFIYNKLQFDAEYLGKIDLDVHANAEYYKYADIYAPQITCDTGGYNVTVEGCTFYDISTSFHQAGLAIRNCIIKNLQPHLLYFGYNNVNYQEYQLIIENSTIYSTESNPYFDLQNSNYEIGAIIIRNNIYNARMRFLRGKTNKLIITDNVINGAIYLTLDVISFDVSNNIINTGQIVLVTNTLSKKNGVGFVTNNIINDLTEHCIFRSIENVSIINNTIESSVRTDMLLIQDISSAIVQNNSFKYDDIYDIVPIDVISYSKCVLVNNTSNSMYTIAKTSDNTGVVLNSSINFIAETAPIKSVSDWLGKSIFIKDSKKLVHQSMGIGGEKVAQFIANKTTPYIGSNPFITNNNYYVHFDRGGTKTIAFSKTQNPTEDDLLYVVRCAYFDDVFVAPDSSVYPYVLATASYGSNTIFDFYVNRDLAEYDGCSVNVNRSGNTDSRPAAIDIYQGFEYLDTDIEQKIMASSLSGGAVIWKAVDGGQPIRRFGTTAQRPAYIHLDLLNSTSVNVGLDASKTNDTTLYFDTTINRLLRPFYRPGVYYVNWGVNGTRSGSNNIPSGATCFIQKKNNASSSTKVYFARTLEDSVDDMLEITLDDRDTFVFIAPDPSVYPYVYAEGVSGEVRISKIIVWCEYDNNAAGVKRSNSTENRPTGRQINVGFMYFDTTLGKPIYASAISGDTVTWVEEDGVIAGTPTSGTFGDKPTVATNNIYVGFKYFCTDKQTTEGATDGIEIIHKGSDVWVDALGRVVS